MTLPTPKKAMKKNGIDCSHPNCSSCENFTEGYTTAFRAVAKELRRIVRKQSNESIATLNDYLELAEQLDGEKVSR